jgi:hypothetical protein
MGTVSVSLPSDGSTADVSDYNTPITTIVNAINGNLDSNNISSVSGTKITAGTLPGSAFDSSTAGGWTSISQTLTYSANNGNKEFVLAATSDPTSYLSPGMKFKVTRNTTPSTQCMSFTAASSMYATIASPTGISFTAAFTCEAWVYLNSYTGSTMSIINRVDTSLTQGFNFQINSSGQLVAYFGTGSSFTTGTSYQSIPLKQWVHVAVTVTVSSKTFSFYVNGTLVPSSLSGTTTTMTQSGNLTIGGRVTGSATEFFDGFIYQPRIWSTAQTQANIQANMGIALTTATNLVFTTADGSFNDASGVGNNLTAQNGASATATGNPYNATEYGLITKVTSSQITVFTGNAGTIPNQTLSSPQYSLGRTPYGFPADENNWVVSYLNIASNSATVTLNTITNINNALTLSVPTGAWQVSYEGSFREGVGSASIAEIVVGIGTTSNTFINETCRDNYSGASVAANYLIYSRGSTAVTNSSMTTYYLNYEVTSGSGTLTGYIGNGSLGTVVFRAKCAYV